LQRKEGLSPTPDEILAEVCLACTGVRPGFRDLPYRSDFKESIRKALEEAPLSADAATRENVDSAAVLTLEAQKRIAAARWNAKGDLETLLFGYEREPRVEKRLFQIYASYAVTLRDLQRKEGLSPTPGDLLRDVHQACKNVRPCFPGLVDRTDFRSFILAALAEDSPTTAQQERRIIVVPEIGSSKADKESRDMHQPNAAAPGLASQEPLIPGGDGPPMDRSTEQRIEAEVTPSRDAGDPATEEPKTPERSRPPKPTLPLDVLEAIAETDRKIRRLLEDCHDSSVPLMLESDVVKATNVMRRHVSEAFKPRAEYYASQSGYCRAWLDEAADETISAILGLVPLIFMGGSRYLDSVPSIRKGLREILQARIEEWLDRISDVDKQKAGDPARLAAVSLQGIAEGAMADIRERKPNSLTVDEMAARIEEDLATLYSAFMDKLLKAEPGKASTVIEEYIGDRFDVRARWYLSAIDKEGHIEPYLATLGWVRDKDVEALIEHFASSLHHRELVDARIVGRISYWKAEAMQRIREKAPNGETTIGQKLPPQRANGAAMADSDFWRKRHVEFLTDAIRFAELRATWKAYFGTWRLWWGSTPEGIQIPPEVLNCLNAAASKALAGLPSSNDSVSQEPWWLWLAFMQKRKWGGFSVTGTVPVSKRVWEAGVGIGRPPVVVRRELGLDGIDEPEADHRLEDLALHNVFRESADFCEDLSRVLSLVTQVPPGVAAADAAQQTPSVERPPDEDRRSIRPAPKDFVDRFKRRPPKRSYEKIAASIGISKDTLYAITKETRWVSDDTYGCVADACGCKPEDLHPRDILRPDRHRS